MVQQITNGIEISVKTKFNGSIVRNQNTFNAFSYFITIENESDDIVQLLERFWEISDALNDKNLLLAKALLDKNQR